MASREPPQCTLGIFTLDKSSMDFLAFVALIYLHKTIQNLSRKASVIKLPKFTTVNMSRKCHQQATFSIENLFFEDYSFGSRMTDVFLD